MCEIEAGAVCLVHGSEHLHMNSERRIEVMVLGPPDPDILAKLERGVCRCRWWVVDGEARNGDNAHVPECCLTRIDGDPQGVEQESEAMA